MSEFISQAGVKIFYNCIEYSIMKQNTNVFLEELVLILKCEKINYQKDFLKLASKSKDKSRKHGN